MLIAADDFTYHLAYVVSFTFSVRGFDVDLTSNSGKEVWAAFSKVHSLNISLQYRVSSLIYPSIPSTYPSLKS